MNEPETVCSPQLPRGAWVALRKLIECVTPHLPEPSDSVIFFEAVTAHSNGNFGEAEQGYRAMLKSNPSHLGALFSLAVGRVMGCHIDDAVTLIDSVISQLEKTNEITLWFGELLHTFSMHELANAYYFEALSACPNNCELETRLGFSLHAMRRAYDAMYHFKRSIYLDDTYAPAWSGLGKVLAELGRGRDASNAFEKAMALSPTSSANYLSLADLGNLSVQSTAFQQLERLSSSNDGAAAEAARPIALLARGAVLERAGRTREALESYIEANKLLRPRIKYHESAAIGRIAKMQATFSPEILSWPCGDPSSLPIFIVGMPRSGSTLVEQVLASHPEVFGADEIGLWGNVLARNQVDVERLSSISSSQLSFVGHDYVNDLRTFSPTAKRIVNKLLGNFVWVGVICRALPNAKIIHTHRDPIDTCVSCFSKYIPVPFSYHLGELGRYYSAYEGLMRHWQSVLPADSILHVRYEDVISDFESQARRIIAFCGLQWNDQCLRFHETRRAVRTVSQNQVRRPLYKNSVGKWTDCNDMLQPLIGALTTNGECAPLGGVTTLEALG